MSNSGTRSAGLTFGFREKNPAGAGGTAVAIATDTRTIRVYDMVRTPEARRTGRHPMLCIGTIVRTACPVLARRTGGTANQPGRSDKGRSPGLSGLLRADGKSRRDRIDVYGGVVCSEFGHHSIDRRHSGQPSERVSSMPQSGRPPHGLVG